MAKLLPKLTPWNYTPEALENEETPPVFRLRPLTQGQIVELQETYKDGAPTPATWYKAGEMSILTVDNLVEADGRPAKWPTCKPRTPASWVAECGAEAWLRSQGFDENGEDLEGN